MEMRRLGGSDLITSAIGLNCLAFTEGCAASGAGYAAAVVGHALDSGVTLLDTTRFGGGADGVVGRAVRTRRDEVVLAARGGVRRTPDGRVVARDGSPDRLARDCEASLRRLGLDHIDLYFLAGTDPRVPIEDSVGALAGLVRAGKIRQIGLLGVDADGLRRAHGAHEVAVLGCEYSLLDRAVEDTLLGTARELDVGVIAYTPLAAGLLTGRIGSLDELAVDDYRRDHPLFDAGAFARNRRLVRAAERFATTRQVGIGRLALAWLLAQGPDVVPVPGTRSRTHLEMNVAATEVRLSTQDTASLTDLGVPCVER